MGTGYVLIVGKDDEKAVIDLFEKLGEKSICFRIYRKIKG